MLNYVNGKIPNNLESLFKERSLSIREVAKISGMSRTTVINIVSGGDSFISKIAQLCDIFDLRLCDIYGEKSQIHQETHTHDNSSAQVVGSQYVSHSYLECKMLRQRITDLENLLESKDKLLKAQEKIIKRYEKKSSD